METRPREAAKSGCVSVDFVCLWLFVMQRQRGGDRQEVLEEETREDSFKMITPVNKEQQNSTRTGGAVLSLSASQFYQLGDVVVNCSLFKNTLF